MSLNIDEIYDLLTWDVSLSEKENEEREKRGIAEASKLKNMYPFIQPILADAKQVEKSSKSAWESCAKVVAMKTDEELEPYIYLLLKWLQDMNWPGADVIFERLSRVHFDIIEQRLEFYIHLAKREDDELWLNTLTALKEHRQW